MSRLATVLTTAALTAGAAQAVTLPDELAGTLEDTLAATMAAAETVLAAPAMPNPGRGPWTNVADLAFLPGSGGVIEEGALRFSWRLHLRNLGLDHDGVEADLLLAAQALADLPLQACNVTEIDIYEVETTFANEPGRFDLALEPSVGQVLVGVYDPRSLEPGLAAIVLTPLNSPTERRALVAHELAHHVHTACHLAGDSEEFAESVEALFQTSRAPERLASAPTGNAPPTRSAPQAVALKDPPSSGGVTTPPAAVRGKPHAHAHARARAARMRKARAAHAAR
jgi:hypothetical protein